MKTIWKFELKIEKFQKVEIPKNAEIIVVKTQKNKPFLWAIVETEAQKENRNFEIIPTGDTLKSKKYDYLGTFFFNDESIVQHVFEIFD